MTPAMPVLAVAPVVASADEMRQRIQPQEPLKGRQPDDAVARRSARAARRRGRRRWRRDLLIEHLHLLNDRFGHCTTATWWRSRRR